MLTHHIDGRPSRSVPATQQQPFNQPGRVQIHAVDPMSSLSSKLAGLAPVRLIIPKMGLNARILSLGPTASGAMQAPMHGGPSDPVWSSVYWWNVGPQPGQTGNAVIAGHVNRPDGSAATFTTLNLLVPGDQIEVVTRSGQTLQFVVQAKDAPLAAVNASNDPTMGRIFGPALTPNLNLMTCWGSWNGQEYTRRLVVYSTLVGVSPFPPASSSSILIAPSVATGA